MAGTELPSPSLIFTIRPCGFLNIKRFFKILRLSSLCDLKTFKYSARKSGNQKGIVCLLTFHLTSYSVALKTCWKKESKKVYNTIFLVFVHSERISFVKTQLIKCDQELVEIPSSVIASPCQPTKHLISRRQHLQI